MEILWNSGILISKFNLYFRKYDLWTNNCKFDNKLFGDTICCFDCINLYNIYCQRDRTVFFLVLLLFYEIVLNSKIMNVTKIVHVLFIYILIINRPGGKNTENSKRNFLTTGGDTRLFYVVFCAAHARYNYCLY